ncbi:MAG: hypothetical protein JW829_16995, partial [Pirellulales bacterium]|nr:hypothetical protein [Pirellulales bacterium]
LAAIAGSPVQLNLVLEKKEVHTESPQSTRRSRRQMRREVGQRPFVQRAAELFDADTDHLKLTLPESDW